MFWNPTADKKCRILICRCKQVFMNLSIAFFNWDKRTKLSPAPLLETVMKKEKHLAYKLHSEENVKA